MQAKNKGKWYYFTDIDIFEGFTYAHSDDVNCDAKGPFDTFTQAKNDALEYHRTTIRYAQKAIRDIKETKNPNKGI